MKSFIKENKYSFPVFYDWDYIADYAYGTGYVPTTVVFDSDGNMIYWEAGMLDSDSIKALLDKAMK